MNGDEALLLVFILEHLVVGGIVAIVILTRWARERRERADEGDAVAQAADAQRQIASVHDEMTQMREMMAELLLDMHAAADASGSRERPGEVGASNDTADTPTRAVR